MGGSFCLPGSQRLRVPFPPLGGQRAPAGGSTHGRRARPPRPQEVERGGGEGLGGTPGLSPGLRGALRLLRGRRRAQEAGMCQKVPNKNKTRNPKQQQQQKMFQEENPPDCDALTHLNPQRVIFASVGRERGRSWYRPPLPLSRDCPRGG